MLSGNFVWIAAIQLLSGLTWAAFELAIVLMFFEAIPRRERMSLVTLYNVSNSAAMVCGTFAGAFVLRYFSESMVGYTVIFGLSSFARIFAVVLLARLSLSQAVEAVPRVVEGALSLHPTTNSMDKPILPGIPETMEPSQAVPAPLGLSRAARPVVAVAPLPLDVAVPAAEPNSASAS
jgi:MFS family permease